MTPLGIFSPYINCRGQGDSQVIYAANMNHTLLNGTPDSKAHGANMRPI